MYFLLKKKFIEKHKKVTLHNLQNFFILFNTFSYIKLNFKLNLDPKMCTFNNLEEIWKTWKKFLKNEQQFFTTKTFTSTFYSIYL